MAKFTSFDAPVGVAGPTDSGTLNADHFGTGKAIAAAGQQIVSLGKTLRVREDARAVTSARAQLSEFQIGFEQLETQRQTDAGIGAPGHFDGTKAAFDQGIAQLHENMNQVQRNAIAPLVQGARLQALRGSLKFQSAAIVKGDLQNMGTIQKGIEGQLFSGKMDMKTANTVLDGMLVDTNLNADKQADMRIAAQPKFRKAQLDGLLSRPTLGVQKLRNGELKDIPPDELESFKKDLLAALKGAGEKEKEIRTMNEIASNKALFDVVLRGGNLSELAQARGATSNEAYNVLREMVIKQSRPPARSEVEKEAARGSMVAKFNTLTMKRRTSGRMTTTGTIRELIGFQNEATKMVRDGYLPMGSISFWNKQIEEVVQRKIGGETGSFFDIFDKLPFQYGNKQIVAHVEDKELPVNEHSRIAKIYERRLTEANIIPSTPSSDARNKKLDEIVQETFKEYAGEVSQTTKSMDDAPNVVVSKGKVTQVAPGTRKLKADKTVANTTQRMLIKQGKHAGKEAWVTLDANGKRIAVEIIEPEQVAPDNRVPQREFDQTGGEGGPADDVPQREFDQTGGEGGPADDVPMLEGPNLEIDSGETQDQTQRRLADEIEDEMAIAEGKALTDVDPDPRRVLASLVDIPPSQQAIDIVQSRLLSSEGIGDDITGIPTGEGGITEIRKAEIVAKKGRPLTDEQARNEAVREDSAALHDNMPGFDVLRAEVQAAVIDLAYTIGINNVLSPVEFNDLRTAIAQGNAPKILEETLDTAIVDGKSVRGLALRRARMFNQASRSFQITAVEQLNDGTINYLSGTEVLFTFKRPRHKKSKAGLDTVGSA